MGMAQIMTARCRVDAAQSAAVSRTTTVETVYIRDPLQEGEVEQHPGKSVIVLGDVPKGCRVVAGGDVFVLGQLLGKVEAGAGGNTNAAVLALRLGPSSELTIGGIAAPKFQGDSQMATIDAARQAVVFKTMPGAVPPAALVPAGEQLGTVGNALVLLLGIGLALAPATVLGSLLHTSGESVVAALLEVFVYGFIVLQGAGLISEGSELLLEVLDPGIVGGVVLPVLGALPDSLIILTSGLGGTREEAQEQVAVGVGTLAGSTILLLSLAWGGSVLLGRCDLSAKNGTAADRTLSPGRSLQDSGVTCDKDVRKGALVMAGSVLLYGTVQVPALLGDSQDPQAALLGSVACLSCFAGYCVYSVLSPELQRRKIESGRRKRFRMYAVQAMAAKSSSSPYGPLLDVSGNVSRATVEHIFDEFDHDRSGKIDSGELQGLLLGLQLAAGGAAAAALTLDQDTIDYWIKEMDVDQDKKITKNEFYESVSRWVREKVALGRPGTFKALLAPNIDNKLLLEMPPDDLQQLQATAAELEAEDPEEAAGDLEEGGDSGPLTGQQITLRAALFLGGGITLCAVFSDPLVEALTNLSRTTGVPAFFIGFVLTPLASNASEFVSSLKFAARKRRKNISLTFSQVYGAVTMNNTLVLGLFLLVVHLQKLEWVYSSEVAVVVAATLAVGAVGASRTTFPASWALPIMAIYPASLGVVYLLDTYLGWQ